MLTPVSGLKAANFPVWRFGPGPDRFARFGHTPEFCRSSLVTMPNLGPDLGPVRLGSGPDRGSEPDCGNPTVALTNAANSY